MSKKILAMFLAVLMVISVLPASVLAAENDCPIAKGEHNLDNCADYNVKEVVAPTCAKAGYTTYECKVCGDVFTGTFTAKLAHVKSSTVEPYKAPTYTEPGHVAKYHCDACDEDWFEGEAYVIAPYDQNTQFDCTSDENPSDYCYMEGDNGIPCSTNGLIHTCAYCGFKVVSRGEHNVDNNAVEIVKAPTATENGEAKAPCTLCGEKVSYVIYPNHDHTANGDSRDTLKAVAVNKNCVTGDVKAHFECVICGKLFVKNGSGALVEKTLAELTGKPKKNGHTNPETAWDNDETIVNGETVKEKANTCTVDGVKIYDCSVCGKEVVETVEAGHDWTETVIIAMTCGQNGITVRECDRCGYTDTVTENAPQHTTYAEYLAAFNAIGKAFDAEALEDLQDADNRPYHDNCYVKDGATFTGFLKPVENSAECGDVNGGEYSWPCLNCGQTRTAASPKLEHNLATYTVPATCAAVSYSFQYCTNANCSLTATGIVKDANNNEYVAVVKTQIEVIEPVLDEDDDIIGYQKVMKDITIETPFVSGKVTAFGAATDPNNHRYTMETKVEPTCTTNGNYFKKCADCGLEVKSTPAATGHTAITNPNHATKAPVTVDPTCETLGSITYYCKNCNEVADEVELPKVTDLQYTDLAVAQAAHNNKLVWVSAQIGTCKQFGYDKYECAGCDHAVIVSDGVSGMGHSDSKTFTLDEAGTVTVPGFNNGGYIFVITAKKGDEVISSGNLPVAITINGVTISKFGVEYQVIDTTAADFDIVLDALHLTNKDVTGVDEDDIYEIDSFTITVNYFVKQYPDCVNNGKTLAHSCINPWCDTDLNTVDRQVYQFAEKKLTKLNHNYQTVKPAVSGVCGEVETLAEIRCTRCNDIKSATINGTTHNDYYDGSIVNEFTPNWNIDEAICANQAPLYDIYYCAECETFHIRNFKDVVPHTWDEGHVTVNPSCATTGEKVYYCTVCGAVSDPEILPAEKHENKNEELFTDHCNDPVTDRHCVVCCECDPDDEDHDCTKKTNGAYTCDCMIGKYHSAEVEATPENWKEATCTTAGQYIAVCDYCKVPDVIIPEKKPGTNEDNKALGHVAPEYLTEADFATKAEWLQYQKTYTKNDGKAYLNYVAPTILAEGSEKFECARCSAIIENPIDRLESLQFSMVATNAEVPTCDEFAPYSLVALNVKATGVDVALASFNMTVDFRGDAEYVGYTWGDKPFLGAVTEPKNFNGSISIVAYASNSNEVSIEDDVLITLYFRVYDDIEFFFVNNSIAAHDALGEEISFSKKGTEIEVRAMLDVNNDGNSFLTSADALLNDLADALKIIEGVEGAPAYDIAADLNRNGQIDLQDITLIIGCVAGNVDRVDLIALNPYQGELELYTIIHGLCLDCHYVGGRHAVTCPNFIVTNP